MEQLSEFSFDNDDDDEEAYDDFVTNFSSIVEKKGSATPRSAARAHSITLGK